MNRKLLGIAAALAVALPLIPALTNGNALAQTAAEPAVIKPVNMSDVWLEQAYQIAWSRLDMMYAYRAKLTGDWRQWKTKFDGQLHSEADLSMALNKLLERVGNPSIHLLTPFEMVAIKAREQGGQLGYGVIAKYLPVYGRTAQIHVTETVCAHNTDPCQIDQGQGYKDGLRSGDVLLAINHESFDGVGMWELHSIIDRHAGQLVFTIRRNGRVMDIALHPTGDRNAHGLDISISMVGGHLQPHVFADMLGPAQQAGLAESNVLEAVNGRPADQMSDAELKALSGECKIGDTLRLKVTSQPQEITIPCGIVPSLDRNMSGNGSWGGKTAVWQFDLRNLDDPRVVHWLESFLAPATGQEDLSHVPVLPAPQGTEPVHVDDGKIHDPVVAVLDLRGAGGTRSEIMEKLASFFIYNGVIDCLVASWRDDSICITSENGVVTEYHVDLTADPSAKIGKVLSSKRIKSVPAPHFGGQVVVIIDDKTSGTALVLAGALQQNGAKVITSGAAVRQLPDLTTHEALAGDPLGRSLEYPVWHFTYGSAGVDLRADAVVPAGQEFDKAGAMLGLDRAPYDQRQYD